MIAPPRISLRRTASYNLHDKGPLLATSSGLSVGHLFFSPPPSPGLPALVSARPRRSPTHPRPSRVLRLVLVWTAGLIALSCLGALATWRQRQLLQDLPGSDQSRAVVPPLRDEAGSEPGRPGPPDADLVGQDEVPDFPTPVLLVSSPGGGGGASPRWTVSIPPGHPFPLPMREYGEMCGRCGEVEARARQEDPRARFVDVREAQTAGLLPGHRQQQQQQQQQQQRRSSGATPRAIWRGEETWAAGDLVGLDDDVMETPPCGRTLTFVLESADAGLGKGLMLLWSFYGLAERQGRAFFIDDTRWPYGNYTAIFQHPPAPGCRPPSRQEMIPCPAQANHLVVTAATAPEIFPELMAEKAGREPQRELFALARRGYEALFRLNDGDGDHVRARVGELTGRALKTRKVVVGAHVRRGDRHPVEFQYRRSYIPTHVFTEKARARLRPAPAGANKADAKADSHPGDGPERQILTVVASDDPVVYEAEEFAGSFRAQERIRLASKSLIQQVSQHRRNDHHGHSNHGTGKYVDDTFGWEGGFFAAMFWSLGTPLSTDSTAAAAADASSSLSPTSSPDSAASSAPSAQTLRLRSLVGRAYAMDLAVLAGASDVIVCAASATGCRLLAVMMGWERAIEGRNWVNVDGEYGWSGIAGDEGVFHQR